MPLPMLTLAMQEAVSDANLTEEQYSDPRVGLIVGTGGASSSNPRNLPIHCVKRR